MRSHNEDLYRPAMRRVAVLPCKVVLGLLLAFTLRGAWGEVEVTVMTIEGVVQTLQPASSAAMLTRSEIAEDGRPISVDEFAVIGSDGSSAAFASEGVTADQIGRVSAALHGTTSAQAPGERVVSQKVVRTSAPLLVIQHQRGHPANSNFAPTPAAQFAPQSVSSQQLAGQRGFAVISIGESGHVLAVKTLNEQGITSNAQLRRALASGIKTTFQDERRHDHTVYLAYAVQEQTVSLVGVPVVTMPMCICP